MIRFVVFAGISLLSLALSLGACAQSAARVDEAKTAIAKLGFLVGEWEGPGISFADDGAQTAYYDSEYVRFDLDGSLLLINAKGTRSDGTVSYQLHTVIYYDIESGQYIYTPHAGRTPRSFNCQLDGATKLLCLNASADYRLTFQRLADGRWNEFGERLEKNAGGGAGVWSKSFETILTAAKPDTADSSTP